jgi:hypothetical protein
MSTSLSPLEQLEQQSAQAQPPAQAAPASNLSPLEQLEQQTAKATPSGLPQADPAQEASNTRQMLVSGLTGMPTPNMTEQDKASFARGKAAGAVSVPIVAGATAAATAAPALASTAERVLQVSENALEHLAENYPQLTKLAVKLGYGAGAAGAYKLLNKLGIH